MWTPNDICAMLNKSQLKSCLWLAADWYNFEPEDNETIFESAQRAKEQGLIEMNQIILKAQALGAVF